MRSLFFSVSARSLICFNISISFSSDTVFKIRSINFFIRIRIYVFTIIFFEFWSFGRTLCSVLLYPIIHILNMSRSTHGLHMVQLFVVLHIQCFPIDFRYSINSRGLSVCIIVAPSLITHPQFSSGFQ
jgi:hypothetical protein